MRPARQLPLRIVVMLLIAATAACVSTRARSADTALFLANADSSTDREVLRTTIAAVFRDTLSRRYAFDDEAVKYALLAFARLAGKDSVLRDQVRRIAAMPLRPTRDAHAWHDVTAVSYALDALVDINDQGAADANELRLADPLLAPVAASNLRRVERWDAAPRVLDALERQANSAADYPYDAIPLLHYLEAAPVLPPRTCDVFAQLLRRYRSCLTATANSSVCSDFTRVTGTVQRRLQCVDAP